MDMSRSSTDSGYIDVLPSPPYYVNSGPARFDISGDYSYVGKGEDAYPNGVLILMFMAFASIGNTFAHFCRVSV